MVLSAVEGRGEDEGGGEEDEDGEEDGVHFGSVVILVVPVIIRDFFLRCDFRESN